jgi:hypothetical protein
MLLGCTASPTKYTCGQFTYIIALPPTCSDHSRPSPGRTKYNIKCVHNTSVQQLHDIAANKSSNCTF